MPLTIVRDDLANMRTDAVVVPANSSLKLGGGAGEAVARVAGMARMQAACDEIGGCSVGDAVITPAFDFPAKMVVHAVGPVWMGGQSGEEAALASCVSRSLALATDAGANSVALPLLAAGAFGFPIGEAIAVETRAIQSFLKDHDLDVVLVLYDRDAIRVGRSVFDAIEEYIDDVYIDEREWSRTVSFNRPQFAAAPRFSIPREPEDASIAYDGAAYGVGAPFEEAFSAAMAPATSEDLASRLASLDESFAAMVLRLIDERGLTDVEVYKRANMSRQLFAKIRKDDGYRPTKKTACALAFALGLNHADALTLLSRAGFTLSHSSKFDVIVEYFLLNNIHDIFQINEALFAYDQPLLG